MRWKALAVGAVNGINGFREACVRSGNLIDIIERLEMVFNSGDFGVSTC